MNRNFSIAFDLQHIEKNPVVLLKHDFCIECTLLKCIDFEDDTFLGLTTEFVQSAFSPISAKCVCWSRLASVEITKARINCCFVTICKESSKSHKTTIFHIVPNFRSNSGIPDIFYKDDTAERRKLYFSYDISGFITFT